MQQNELSQPALEELYEKVILPQFGVMGDISWDEHLVVGPDSEAHVFIYNNKRMALVFDDYPMTSAKDLSLEFPYTTVTPIMLDVGTNNAVVIDDNRQAGDDMYVLRFGPGALPSKYVYNVTGYFQLFSIDPLGP